MPQSSVIYIDKIFESLSKVSPLVVKDENSIFIDNEAKDKLLVESKDKILFYRSNFNQTDGKFELLNNPKQIEVSKKIHEDDIFDILLFSNRGFYFKHLTKIRSILRLNFDIDKIVISDSFDGIKVYSATKTVHISLNKYIDMVNDIAKSIKTGNSYKASVERHLFNTLSKKYRNIDISKMTSVTFGEFNFLINRFNLSTKRKLQDFKKVLNNTDINALQELTVSMVKNRVFEEDFFRKLNNYFIKENLEEIIKLGNRILALKTDKMNTNAVKKIIKKISPNKQIKQFETVWQKYFEDNLLYLIFSYKKIYSKIGLMIEQSEKKPDFVGINHYNGVDIIEIKKHTTPALVYDKSHNNFSFSPDMSKAIIQATNYLDSLRSGSFADDEDKEKITKFTDGENLYRPRAIIVISSWPHIIKNKDLIESKISLIRRDFAKLRNSLEGITIMTFDEVMSISENYIQNILD